MTALFDTKMTHGVAKICRKGGNGMSNRILIAEDEARLREVLCDFFVSKGDV